MSKELDETTKAIIAALERVRDSGPPPTDRPFGWMWEGRMKGRMDWIDHINAEINKLREQGK